MGRIVVIVVRGWGLHCGGRAVGDDCGGGTSVIVVRKWLYSRDSEQLVIVS